MTPEERAEFITDVASAIRQQEPVLTEEEQLWVRLAIQKEAQSIKLRAAVIEKTLAGLVWVVLLLCGVILKEWLEAHGWKP